MIDVKDCPELYQKPTDLPPLVRAAYAVAESVHKRQVRKKETGTLPYITHINMVGNLLRAVGVTDEVTLAAAVLHDVIEDCTNDAGGRVLNRASLSDWLLDECKKQDLDIFDNDVAHNVFRTVNIVKEVTNPRERVQDKRSIQTDHAPNLTFEAKMVKVADQAASMADDIMMKSARGDSQLRDFAYKARDVVSAMGNPTDKKYPKMSDEQTQMFSEMRELFRTIFHYDLCVLNADTELRGTLRAQFTLEQALETSEESKHRAEVNYTPTKTVVRDKISGRPGAFGSVGEVQFDALGDVMAYKMRVNSKAGATDLYNQTSLRLMEHIELNSARNRSMSPHQGLFGLRMVRSGPITEQAGGAEYKLMRLDPPLSQKKFKAYVDDVHAFDELMSEAWFAGRPKAQVTRGELPESAKPGWSNDDQTPDSRIHYPRTLPLDSPLRVAQEQESNNTAISR